MTLPQLRIRLCPADLDLFGCAEELTLDFEALKDLTADELEELDSEVEFAVAALIPLAEAGSEVARVRRCAVWLALRQAGTPIAYDKCKPLLLRAEFEMETQPGPPDGPSETSSEGEAPASS
jgi:hypothetical protein